MGNSGGLFNNNIFHPFHCIFQLYHIEEMGRNQNAQRDCAQRFSEVASASESSARDAQEWVVPCPTTVHAHENQDHGYGSRALKPQLSAATLHQSKTH